MKRYVILATVLCLLTVAGCKTPPSNKEPEPSIPATPIEDNAVKTPAEEPAVSPDQASNPVVEEPAKPAAIPQPEPDKTPVAMAPPPEDPQPKPKAKKSPPKTTPAAKTPAKKPAATPKKQDDKAAAAKTPAKKPAATPKKQDDKTAATKTPAKPAATPKKQDDKAAAAKTPAKKPAATPKKQDDKAAAKTPAKPAATPKEQDDKAATAAKTPAKPAAAPKKQDDKTVAAKTPAKPAATPQKQDDKAAAAKTPAKPAATPKEQDDKTAAATTPTKKPAATPKKQDDKTVAAKTPAQKPVATPKKQDDKAATAKTPAKKPAATPKKQDDKAATAKTPAKKPAATPKKQDDKAATAAKTPAKPAATPKKQDDTAATATKTPAKPVEKPKSPTLPAASAVITDVACLVEQADASFVSKKHTGRGKMYVTVLAKYKGELAEQDFQEAQILSPADTWHIDAQTARNLIEIDKKSKLLLLKHLAAGSGEGSVALGNWDISITLQGQKPFEKRIQIDGIGASDSDSADRIKRKMQNGQRFYIVPTVMEFNEQPALHTPVIQSVSRDNDTIEIVFSIDDERVKNGYFYFDVPGEQYYRDSGSLIDAGGLPVNGCRSFSVDGKQCQYVLRKDDSNKAWFDKAERCFFVVSDINRVAAPGKEQHRSISAAATVVKK